VAGKYQKVVLTVIVGGSLIGIGFQHYVRGPRQRLERFKAVLEAKEWSVLADLYSDEDWRKTTWTKATFISFLKTYVEPNAGRTVELQEFQIDFSGTPTHRISIIQPSSGGDLFFVDQIPKARSLGSFSGVRVEFLLGWEEPCPTMREVIACIATSLYPHRLEKDTAKEVALSQYEFLLAEHKRLNQIGVKYILPAGLGMPAKTIGDYLSEIRHQYSRDWEPFGIIDAKYSEHLR